MRNYDYINKWQPLLEPDIVAMLSQIHEHKGEHNFYVETKSEMLTQLVETAKIQSTEASNKIEGIYTSGDRLKKLASNKAKPQTRDEQEIAGYRDVLATIHENYEYIPLSSSIILQLHRDLYKFSGRTIGGVYKVSDNVITEEDSFGNKYIRFKPVAVWETPQAIDSVCSAFDDAVNKEGLDPLLIIPMFVLDFLCIHPFNDGNGRMSRLLTLLLLYRAGYNVGKYISIEKLIEQTKETYYQSLADSSYMWHEEKSDYSHFVRYTLGIILAAYREFSDKVMGDPFKDLSKPQRVGAVIRNTFGKLTKSEIAEKCPDISITTIQRSLNDLVKQGKILKIGGGRYTSYIWNRENEK